jgi:hypothetical protein
MRYIIFGFSQDLPCGGADDIYSATDSLDAAVQVAASVVGRYLHTRYQILDTRDCRLIAQGHIPYEGPAVWMHMDNALGKRIADAALVLHLNTLSN